MESSDADSSKTAANANRFAGTFVVRLSVSPLSRSCPSTLAVPACRRTGRSRGDDLEPSSPSAEVDANGVDLKRSVWEFIDGYRAIQPPYNTDRICSRTHLREVSRQSCNEVSLPQRGSKCLVLVVGSHGTIKSPQQRPAHRNEQRCGQSGTSSHDPPVPYSTDSRAKS
ncbi:MAG: hypothetical protein U0325_08725 [Polyangiales bacterium]